MKTQQQITLEIDEILTPYRASQNTPPTKICKQIAVLRNLILYLESNPPEEEVAAQLHRIEREIAIYTRRFRDFKAPKDIEAKGSRAIESYYNELHGITYLRRKCLNLKYLLS